MRPYLNKVYKAEFDGACSGEFIVLKCKENLNPDLLKYLLHSREFVRFANKKTSGDRPRISFEEIADYPICLPPLDEQSKLVSKIEELFSELDNSIEQLKIAQRQLKIYRQSVLKWAFEGRLTNEDAKEGELPVGWKWVKLEELMESVRNGYSKKPDDSGSYKILRISSVRPNKVDLSDIRYLKEAIGSENSIEENDLLFTRYNGSRELVGVAGVVPRLSGTIYYPDKIIRCRSKLKDRDHAVYLQYACNSGKARDFVLSKLKTTAGQTGISGAEIKQLPIPLAPIHEQYEIIQEIESRLSVADKVEETIKNSLEQAEALRQSILKNAFNGKLL